MKNKLSHLNNHLFAQLERLSDETLTPEQIEQEVERAKAIVGVSDQIVGAAALQFKAAELVAKHGRGVSDMIPESMGGRQQIEHVRAEGPKTDEERERAEAEARRIAREAVEERQEWARQGAVQ
ncbi:hypothetical protein [Aureimonas glaciei]|uniref:Uncharacterized protein n=1 Tax=Aureimonas glaciei TaxID=1776957 RepID=A0A916YFW7_9HYPH|nr:hypothetical protein [Aureimonas glaciei]GGD43231.1 hypothetical protein GCM10011335_52360 [Aureimonas glaciei]